MILLHGDIRMAAAAATACLIGPIPRLGRRSTGTPAPPPASYRFPRFSCYSSPPSSSASSPGARSQVPAVASPQAVANAAAVAGGKKPAVCTADELHYVDVPGTEWRLALWRYLPSSEAPLRNHPLVLLSGVGTNAIGFDLSPGASFARHMSSHGFDTWIVEVRGAGLSTRINSKMTESTDSKCKNGSLSEQQNLIINGSPQDFSMSPISESKATTLTSWDESKLVEKLTDALMRLTEKFSGYLSESQLKVISDKFFDEISQLMEEAALAERFNEIQGKISVLIEARQNSLASSQIRDLSNRIVTLLDEGQRSVSPQLIDLQERLIGTIEDFQKQLDLIVTYNWDFDHYLEEDIPAAMEYIKIHCKSRDGKVLAIGHSMGGILLYAMLSRYGFEGKESGLAAVITLASSLDYTSSNSSLKLLLPLADPAQVLNVPVIPLGALLTAAYPLASRPPYVLSWLNHQISAQDMMHPELFEKLVFNNFCTIPAKLLLQLTTAFRPGGLRNRFGTFLYKDFLHKCNVPVLALAGDRDLICPPEAVYETVKCFPPHIVTYKVFGKPDGPHYGHYDLVGGRLAVKEEYPCIVDFLCHHDRIYRDGDSN